jgi:hypothetical protein
MNEALEKYRWYSKDGSRVRPRYIHFTVSSCRCFTSTNCKGPVSLVCAMLPLSERPCAKTCYSPSWTALIRFRLLPTSRVVGSGGGLYLYGDNR